MSTLNTLDFIGLKGELDDLCCDDVDIYTRWDILEHIRESQVYKNVDLFTAVGGIRELCTLLTQPSTLSDQSIYLDQEDNFAKDTPLLGSLRVGAIAIVAEMTKMEEYRREMWKLNLVGNLAEIFKQRMGYLQKYVTDPISTDLSRDLPRDITLLLLDRILFCLSYLAIGSSLVATELLRLLGTELLLVVTAVNNTHTCDSIARLLDYCFLYEPNPTDVKTFLLQHPGERLHALRPRCSEEDGRDRFDRLMKSLDKYLYLLDPVEELKASKITSPHVSKYIRLLKCGYCGSEKDRMPVCAACHVTRYCSTRCQTQHWLTHQITCCRS